MSYYIHFIPVCSWHIEVTSLLLLPLRFFLPTRLISRPTCWFVSFFHCYSLWKLMLLFERQILPTNISNLCVPLRSNSLQILVTYVTQHANRLDKQELLVCELRFAVIVVSWVLILCILDFYHVVERGGARQFRNVRNRLRYYSVS